MTSGNEEAMRVLAAQMWPLGELCVSDSTLTPPPTTRRRREQLRSQSPSPRNLVFGRKTPSPGTSTATGFRGSNEDAGTRQRDARSERLERSRAATEEIQRGHKDSSVGEIRGESAARRAMKKYRAEVAAAAAAELGLAEWQIDADYEQQKIRAANDEAETHDDEEAAALAFLAELEDSEDARGAARVWCPICLQGEFSVHFSDSTHFLTCSCGVVVIGSPVEVQSQLSSAVARHEDSGCPFDVRFVVGDQPLGQNVPSAIWFTCSQCGASERTL
jgi:hypothetical protein